VSERAAQTDDQKERFASPEAGPAAGLHIGVLKGRQDAGITFDTKDDVWALSSIGCRSRKFNPAGLAQ
jgi:hypothetical protein